MKPRNKRQREVLKLSQHLSKLTDYQKKQAIKHVGLHIAKLDSKCNYVCLDCGYTWHGETADTVVCPHCAMKLNVDSSRKRNFRDANYFMVITTSGGYQVLRTYLMRCYLKRGEKADYEIYEVFQRWFKSDGKSTLISRARVYPARYCDTWSFGSDLEIRTESYAHSVTPYKVIGQICVIPEIARNGFDGDFHDCDPYRLFQELLTNNKFETVWKSGQYNLAHYMMSTFKDMRKYWPAIKIAIRHGYKVVDPNLWFDMLYAIDDLDKDIRNPQYVCPKNLKEAHDLWIGRKEAKDIREQARIEAARAFEVGQRYLSDEKKHEQDEERYREAKSKFFDISLNDNDLAITPLKSITEFIEEYRQMHHCVFTCKYYEKEESLILHATQAGKIIATIELNLTTMKIIQCRGVYNSEPPMKDKIISMIENNINLFVNKMTA